ncbi:hypothetical protein [Gracilibacillus kekensis]|uniref:hypothetical protein n=1 Tax=Gracilibacillus kekensis TaxID=1027249 RepID=UPI00147A0466|nr:hypothetical protein [Gracilibacillus kekensis]
MNKLETSINKTWGWVTARDEDGMLVGFVRAFSDSLQHAYVLHLLIHPQYP